MTTTRPSAHTARRSITRGLAVLAAGTLAAFSLAACSKSVSSSDVEEQISSQLEAQVGVAPDSVSCADDLPAEEGASITCELTSEGQTYGVTATVSSIDGNTVNFDIEVADAPTE